MVRDYDGAVEVGGMLELGAAVMLSHVRFGGSVEELGAELERLGWRREGDFYVKAVNRRERAEQGQLSGF